MKHDTGFISEHYADQIKALKAFINETFGNLPGKNSSLVRFGGGTALAIYYYRHRLSFDIDLFATDPQIIGYLSPKQWLEEAAEFNQESYIDQPNHIRVLFRQNNIKVDVLVAQDFITAPLIDKTHTFFPYDLYVESVEDIIAKKVVYRRKENLTRDIIDIAIAITKNDILRHLFDKEALHSDDLRELQKAVEGLDRKNYDEELEIVSPFENYRTTAVEAPDIIVAACRDILGG